MSGSDYQPFGSEGPNHWYSPGAHALIGVLDRLPGSDMRLPDLDMSGSSNRPGSGTSADRPRGTRSPKEPWAGPVPV